MRWYRLSLVVSLLLLLSLLLLVSSITVSDSKDESPYLIILDGGSTGSRLHVFEFVEHPHPHSNNNNNSSSSSVSSSSSSFECVRRGTHKVPIPLTAFADDFHENNNTDIADHLMPAFEYAAQSIVPERYHKTTRVLYQATAGMRLLSEQKQQQMYATLYRQLNARSDFVFLLENKDDVATLSGQWEGFYGAVAANYLEGAVRGNLDLVKRSSSSSSSSSSLLVGALDMGGSSTQIVFLPHDHADALAASEDNHVDYSNNSNEAEEKEEPPVCVNNEEDEETSSSCVPQQEKLPKDGNNKLQTDGFFIHSYLSYGVDQFRMRLWNNWIDEHRRQLVAEFGEDACDAKRIENPCVFHGYTIDYEGYTLVGTGHAQECANKVRDFLLSLSSSTLSSSSGASSTSTSATNTTKQKYSVGGVEHPPVRGKFYAMSNYFYTLDSVRQFVATLLIDKDNNGNDEEVAAAAAALHQSWPTPTLNELSQALPLFCNRAWKVVEKHHEDIPHAYTQPHLLPHRCLEAVYMTTLLKDGFGFDPHARDITYALEVGDSEVEWTLGMALVLKNTPPTATTTTSTTVETPTTIITDQQQPVQVVVQECELEDLTLSSLSSMDEVAEEEEEPQQQEQEERQNVTTKIHKGPFFSYYYNNYSSPLVVNALHSTRKMIWQRVAEFIVTASTLDYMHTI